MQQVDLSVAVRDGRGKGAARKLRAAGRIPGILYGEKKEPVSISLVRRDLAMAMQKHEGKHLLVNLTVEGEATGSTLAFLQELTVHPVTNILEHADFRRLDPQKPVRTTVAIHLTGSPIGVKLGGTHQHVLRELEVEGIPTQLPETIEVDITPVGLNQSIHVADLAHEGLGYTILTPGDRVISTVTTPRAAVEETPAEGGVTPPAPAA